ncbi:MAG: hypothetical protein J0L61_08795 [Planctomycetes bacterium]|nr:hypothetical protein [Planctomycetota bacterium]
MAEKPTCLVCEKEMVRGFLVDQGDYASLHSARWAEGAPESSWWSGEVKHRQLKGGYKIVAYRCPQCEALRLYAPADKE